MNVIINSTGGINNFVDSMKVLDFEGTTIINGHLLNNLVKDFIIIKEINISLCKIKKKR